MNKIEGRRVVVKGPVQFVHQDPASHPFNDYSNESLNSDREVHNNLDWLTSQVNEHHRQWEENQNRDNDRNNDNNSNDGR